jgi:radical SAM protein with 4Fe4S-binding SPASM domain
LSADDVERALRRCPSYDTLVAPVLGEIRAVYATFLHRDPTPRELLEHFDCFRWRWPSRAEAREVVRTGRVRSYIGVRPLYAEVDITNQCNIRCKMCHFSDPSVSRRRRHDISLEDFARLGEQLFPLCHLLSLSFGTEPLLHKQFYEFLEIIKVHEVPHTFITTNALLLNEALIERIVRQSVLKTFAVSIDGATRETYERIRVGGRFEKLVENIRMIGRVRRRLGARDPRVTFVMVLMRSNVEELPALIRLARDLGVSEVTAIHMVPYAMGGGDTGAESLAAHKELCNRVLDEARETAAKYKVRARLPDNFGSRARPDLMVDKNFFHLLKVREEDRSRSSCHFPWHYVGVDPYGLVNPCGWWYGEPSMGNILTERFEAIWNNERYRALRAEHLTRALRPTCRDCPAAALGNVDNEGAFSVRRPTGPAFLGEPGEGAR